MFLHNTQAWYFILPINNVLTSLIVHIGVWLRITLVLDIRWLLELNKTDLKRFQRNLIFDLGDIL